MDGDQISQFVSSVGVTIVGCAFMAWLYVRQGETLEGVRVAIKGHNAEYESQV